MAKTASVGVRLDPDIKNALRREATADGRSLSAKIAHILTNWVRQLPAEETFAAPLNKTKERRR